MTMRVAKSLVITVALIGIVPCAFRAALAAAGQVRGGRGGLNQPDPLVVDDHTGFESIFDGKSMKGWDGDPTFWRVENGALVGESTPEKPLKVNTFLIWRGGQPADFELK